MALKDTSGKGVCSQCLSSKGTEEDILMLQCSFCSCFIHTSCLRVEDPPFTTLAGDNFFDLVCSECSRSDDGFDIVRRGRMKVHVAILLALYNLHKNSPRPGRDGFYHWRDDIFSYINRHHHLFFPQEQSRIVPASFCATMTKFPNWIESGNSNPMIKSRGYYRLVSVKPPAVLLMQTVGPVAAVGGPSAQRPSSKRGGTVSRSPLSRLRSPRTRQNLRDLAQAVEEAVAELEEKEPSALSSSSSATVTEVTTIAGAASSSSGTAATPASMSSDDEEDEEIASRRDFEGFGRLSQTRGSSQASARPPQDKQDNGSLQDPSSDLRTRRESSGPRGHRGTSSCSPKTRFSPRTALGNSSPMEGNFRWLENIAAVPQLDKNLDMIFSDDFLSIANVEEVVGSSENNRAPISGSPSERSTVDQLSPRDNNVNWSDDIASTSGFNRETSGHNSRLPSESGLRAEDDRGNEGRTGSNILHGDALRNSLSQNKVSKCKSRSTRLLSPPSSTDTISKMHSEAALDVPLDTRGRPPAPSSQSSEVPLPHKRHKLALTFRPNKQPFVLDKQYKEDMQFVESLTPKNMYEEVQLLKKLDNYYNKVGSANFSPLLVPLRRKLTVRKEQRLHNIGVFNPHAETKSLQEKGRCLTNEERIDLDNHNKFGVTGCHLLDRFLKAEEVEQERVWPPGTAFRERLLGTDIRNIKPFSSPYSGKLLLPYYLQLKEYKKPLKLLLNEEIKVYSALGELTRAYNLMPSPEGACSAPIAPPADEIQARLRQILGAPLHFGPARSEHIPQMNALARQCFWPGICLSEVLKYPEFTCVALYKFLVVGFCVALPDSGVCGEEAYISFLVVHPEWRRSKIASTMLYCLSEEINTDITLHVSPSNQAMQLYQRFGFKSEEFIKNFYDKYLPEGHTDSKHAFFMRRRRML